MKRVNVEGREYDALGRLLEMQQPFTTESGTTYYAITQYVYDLNGNVTTQKTVNSEPGEMQTWAQTNYAYDSRDHLVMVTTYDNSAAENYTQYYYDVLGNTLRMYTGLSSPLTISGLDSVSGTDTEYSVTSYVYDRFSNLTSTTDPLGQTESYSYDINGNALTKTDRNGAVTTYTYDDIGQLTNTAVVTTDGEGDASLTYTYALTGLMLSESDGAYTTAYVYDALGRLVQETTGTTVNAYTYNIGDARTRFALTVDSVQQLNTYI